MPFVFAILYIIIGEIEIYLCINAITLFAKICYGVATFTMGFCSALMFTKGVYK